MQHWAENIPHITSEDGKSNVTLWAGTLGSKVGMAPPPNSWAQQADSDVAVLHISRAPGGEVTLPAAAGGSTTHTSVRTGASELLAILDTEPYLCTFYSTFPCSSYSTWSYS